MVQDELVSKYYDVVVGKLKRYEPIDGEVNRKKGAIEQYLLYEAWLLDALSENLPKRVRASKGVIVRTESNQRSGDCDVIVHLPSVVHQASQLAIVEAEDVVAEIGVVGQLKDPTSENLIRYEEELRPLTRNLGVVAYFGDRAKLPSWDRQGVKAFLLSEGFPTFKQPIVPGEFERLLTWISGLRR